MASPLYLDTSAVLRAILESGVSHDLEKRLAAAPVLITSRLSLVEATRALHRLRANRAVTEPQLSDAARDVNQLWSRCDIWELTRSICDRAEQIAPGSHLRTLDALHLATFSLARERIPGLELLTADEHLRNAAVSVS